MEHYVLRVEDEPPDQIQNIKSNHNTDRGIKHTLEHFYRLLLWRGTLHHRSGSSLSAGGGIGNRWLYLVLGTGKHERKVGERAGKDGE